MKRILYNKVRKEKSFIQSYILHNFAISTFLVQGPNPYKLI